MDSRQTVFGKSLESLWRVFRQFLDSLRIFFTVFGIPLDSFSLKTIFDSLWTALGHCLQVH